MSAIDFRITISGEILANVARLDRLRGRWAGGPNVPPERLARLEEAARIQSVAASCRLAGIRASDFDVAGLLRGEGAAFPVADAGELRGYAAAMGRALPAGNDLLGTTHLRKLHATLLGAPAEDPQPTPWRVKPLEREAFDAEGRATGRIFSTLPPRMIESKVKDLLTWLECELRSGQQHPVLVTGTFTLALLAASPFDQANGRLARVLVGPLLRRAGYEYMPYASVESQFEDRREAFQEAFGAAETRIWSGGARLEPWLTFLVGALDGHRDRVETKIELEHEATALPPLQREILKTVREHGSVDAGLLLKATGANRNTLKDNLKRLVERGVLDRTGQRRGTRYRLAAGDPARSERGRVLA